MGGNMKRDLCLWVCVNTNVQILCKLHSCVICCRETVSWGQIHQEPLRWGEITAPSHREPFMCHLVHGDMLKHERLSPQGFHKPAVV